MNKDFLTDTDGDLLILDGDFVLGDSLKREIEDILLLTPGQLREDGFLGVGLLSWINDEHSLAGAKTEIERHLKRDGKHLITFMVQNSKIVIDAE